MRQAVQEEDHAHDQPEVARHPRDRRVLDQPERVRLLVAVAQHDQHQPGKRRRLVVAHLEAGAAGGRHRASHVAGERTRHQLGHGRTEAGRQLLGQAEIEETDHRARHDEQVPRVGIALEETLLEDHARIETADATRHLAEVVARGAQPLEIGHLDAVEVLEHQELPGGEVAVDARHAHRGIVGEGGADADRRVALAREVELEAHKLGDLVNDAAEIEAPRHAAGDACQKAEAGQVDARQPRDLRVLHLHHHRRAVAERGPVHLRQRRRGQRRLVHLREHLVQRAAELALDLGSHLPERPGRYGVVKAAEAADEDLGEGVGTRAHHLTELHEESRQVDAKIVQATSDVVVHALPGLGRRPPAEPPAQLEPAVGEDGRHGDAGDAQDPVDGQPSQHRQAAFRIWGRSSATVASGRDRRPSTTTSATTPSIPATARRPSQVSSRTTGSKIDGIAESLLSSSRTPEARVGFIH